MVALNEIKNGLPGILYTDISDHFPIFYCFRPTNPASKEEKPKFFTKRFFSTANKTKFNQLMLNTDWSPVYDNKDAQDSFTIFQKIIIMHYEEAFPLTQVKVGYHNRKPWLTIALKNSIKNKNKLYFMYRKSPSCENEIKYKKYRNKLNSLIRIAERKHYHQLLENNKNNIKKSWSVLKEIIGNESSTTTCNMELKDGDNIVTNENEIAHLFNDYFVTIGSSLSQKLPTVDNVSPTYFMKSCNPESMFVNPVSKEELNRVIQNLKNSSPGYDNLSPCIIKEFSDHLIDPLLHIINLSFSQGVFPDELKLAKVLPLFKNGDKMLINNYRPVSILPSLSKIYEKLMYDKLNSFLDQNDILNDHQFGFRSKHSTSMALSLLVDKILDALDNNELVLGVFLDFSKAFDTIDHRILLKKLEHYGVRGLSLSWFDSYLTCRKQFVSYNNAKSETANISCGVPQGSILGPLLFIIYINDIVRVSNVLFPVVFADDTNVFIQGKNIDTMCKTMNAELEKLLHWLNINKLSLNVNKTHYMVFHKSRHKVSMCHKLSINNVEINYVDKTKFLGVIIDSKLSWKEHIKHITSKLAKSIGIISKARKFVDNKSLLTLYYAFCYPYIKYCIEIWGGTNDTTLLPLIKRQKRLVRVISGAPYRAHTENLFKELNVLKLNNVFQLSVSMFMYKFVNGLLPNVFKNFYKCNNMNHSYNTRQSSLFQTPAVKSDLLFRSIRIKGVHIWNYLFKNIDVNVGLSSFKYNVKKLLQSTEQH